MDKQVMLNAAEAAYSLGSDADGGDSVLREAGYVYERSYTNPENGLKAVVYKQQETGDLTVAFAGTDGLDGADIPSDLDYGWNQFFPLKDKLMEGIGDMLGSDNSDAQVHFTGHSLGGMLAQYAAYEYASATEMDPDAAEFDLFTVNSPGGHARLEQAYDDFRPDLIRPESTYHVRMEGDVISKLGEDHLGGPVRTIPNEASPSMVEHLDPVYGPEVPAGPGPQPEREQVGTEAPEFPFEAIDALGLLNPTLVNPVEVVQALDWGKYVGESHSVHTVLEAIGSDDFAVAEVDEDFEYIGIPDGIENGGALINAALNTGGDPRVFEEDGQRVGAWEYDGPSEAWHLKNSATWEPVVAPDEVRQGLDAALEARRAEFIADEENRGDLTVAEYKVFLDRYEEGQEWLEAGSGEQVAESPDPSVDVSQDLEIDAPADDPDASEEWAEWEYDGSDLDIDVPDVDLDNPFDELDTDQLEAALDNAGVDWDNPLEWENPFGDASIDLGGLGLDGDFSTEIPGSELAEELYDRRDQVEDLYEAIDKGDDWKAGDIGLNLVGDLTETEGYGKAGDWLGHIGGIDSALERNDDWGAAESALDLTADVGEWADWDSGTVKGLGTAAGAVGGVAALASADDLIDQGEYDQLMDGAASLATAFGADSFASSLGDFAPYVGIVAGLAEGDAEAVAESAITMSVPYAGVITSLAEGDPMGAAIGAISVAVPWVGAAFAIASALGVFGSDPPPPPEAEATLRADEHGNFYVHSATDAHGGNAGSMSVAAERAANTINNLVDATGGRILDPDALQSLQIGYDGKGLYAGGERFDSVSDAIAHLVQQTLADTAIEGGDVFIKRAVYRSLEGGDVDIAAIFDAVETAQAYSRHQSQSVQIERLSEDEAVADELAAYQAGEISRNDLSDAAQLVLDARETEAEARELGLHRNHRFDDASRLNEAFEANGIDLADVAVTDLQIANLHGELVVAVRDPENPDTPIRDLPHAVVDAYANDFDAAMLYLDGGGWNLEDLLTLAGIEPGDGAVDIEDALIERYGADAESVVMGSAADDALTGTSADEALIGWQGSDVLRAGAGDDTLIGGQGYDTLHGGEGEDTADYSASAQGVAVDLDTGKGRGGDAQGDRLQGIEHLEGSLHDDHLAGDEQGNTLTGNAGDDVLIGRGGEDTLHGGEGHDRLDGGQGDDLLAAGAGDDFLDGGTGDDRLSGGAGDDQLTAGEGDDFVMAGSGDDRVLGGAGDDLLSGGAGNDVIGGGEGHDTVLGGAGDDALLATGGGDTLHGGEGSDAVVYEHDMADYRVELVDGEIRIADPETRGLGDRLIDIETVQFGDRVVSVETLKEYLTILDDADEEERQRRINGIASSGTIAIGDAAVTINLFRQQCRTQSRFAGGFTESKTPPLISATCQA